MSENILEVSNLVISFKTQFGTFTPVDEVEFYLRKGETLGIVGESGCGKTVTAFSIIRLLPKNAVLGDKTRILFEGKNISECTKEEIQKIRGKKISMIFQEPMTSLNPVYTIGQQLSEVFLLHEGLSEKEAKQRSIGLLEMVRIPEPAKRINDYPHLLSGGMRQRVMIAMALACKPMLLIADEPTTALDVTIQAQILELIHELKSAQNTSAIIITHDLGVVAEMCNRVIVMYAGQIVETGTIFQIFDEPSHPYTRGLIRSIPKLTVEKNRQEKLHVIEGYVPHPSSFPKGCRFHPRCDEKFERCGEENPPLFVTESGHFVKCWMYGEKGGDN
jgi:peptide/nickel transport system ATP-binding protein/oligopeptide transport system ATP-binding protein